ncbi:FAD/NAD-binding domain-containing protein [Gymnopilus junonius]|uniref:FAD/NAD-binding domain-containing protein n=1 Tax=Gymnopilus junonius TaxID=109634 RepID=A0A9P5TSG4_GYMJU|nr:FAD/NAD-binding domain-containing protein [Gymnopilus junonius]
MDPKQGGPSVAIVGAGFGGLAAAISLEKQGFRNFTIYEKGSDVGGTWRENIYPGATSDISIHYYSFSTDLNPDWDRTCAYQPDILKYLQDVSNKHGFYKNIVFNTKFVSAEWDAASQKYDIVTEDVVTGAKTSRTATVLISAPGPLHIPKYPDFPGLDEYKGIKLHSAKWDKNIDLRGKRVAVIGNGSSGSQLTPRLAEVEGIQLSQFIRSGNWVLPNGARHINGAVKWAFRYIPFLQRAFRYLLFWFFEFVYLLIFGNNFMRGPLVKFATTVLSIYAPKEYLPLLIPKFPMGCRRIIFEDKYLASLHKPNVSLKDSSKIASLDKDGIVMADVVSNTNPRGIGENLPFDVIVFATGFITDAFPYHLHGTNSTIQEYYDKTGGPNAYLGITVPGFPNFYQVMGPNTATGYTSVVFFIETQVGYMTQLIKPVIEGKASSLEVLPGPTETYVNKVQRMFDDTVFNFCGSWYRVKGSGRNVMIFPGSAIKFWWWCRNVVWSDYKVVGLDGKQTKEFAKKNTPSSGLTALTCAATVFAGVAWWRVSNGFNSVFNSANNA